MTEYKTRSKRLLLHTILIASIIKTIQLITWFVAMAREIHYISFFQLTLHKGVKWLPERLTGIIPVSIDD